MADPADPARHFASEAFALFSPRREWQPSRAGPGCSKYPSASSRRTSGDLPPLCSKRTPSLEMSYLNSRRRAGFSFHSLILKPDSFLRYFNAAEVEDRCQLGERTSRPFNPDKTRTGEGVYLTVHVSPCRSVSRRHGPVHEGL